MHLPICYLTAPTPLCFSCSDSILPSGDTNRPTGKSRANSTESPNEARSQGKSYNTFPSDSKQKQTSIVNNKYAARQWKQRYGWG